MNDSSRCNVDPQVALPLSAASLFQNQVPNPNTECTSTSSLILDTAGDWIIPEGQPPAPPTSADVYNDYVSFQGPTRSHYLPFDMTTPDYYTISSSCQMDYPVSTSWPSTSTLSRSHELFHYLSATESASLSSSAEQIHLMPNSFNITSAYSPDGFLFFRNKLNPTTLGVPSSTISPPLHTMTPSHAVMTEGANVPIDPFPPRLGTSHTNEIPLITGYSNRGFDLAVHQDELRDPSLPHEYRLRFYGNVPDPCGYTSRHRAAISPFGTTDFIPTGYSPFMGAPESIFRSNPTIPAMTPDFGGSYTSRRARNVSNHAHTMLVNSPVQHPALQAAIPHYWLQPSDPMESPQSPLRSDAFPSTQLSIPDQNRRSSPPGYITNIEELAALKEYFWCCIQSLKDEPEDTSHLATMLNEYRSNLVALGKSELANDQSVHDHGPRKMPPKLKCFVTDCGQLFPSSQRFMRHLFGHLKLKRFKCHICGKPLAGDRSRHLKLVHPTAQASRIKEL